MKITKDVFIEGDLIEGSKVKVFYKGKFTVEYSNEVFIVYGFGLGWKHIKEQKMVWVGNSFCAEIELVSSDSLNFCFKNDFGSWDNNYGKDYLVHIKEKTKQIDVSNVVDEFQTVGFIPKTLDKKQEIQQDLKNEVKEISEKIKIEKKVKKINLKGNKKINRVVRKEKSKKTKNIKRIIRFGFLLVLIGCIICFGINYLNSQNVKNDAKNLLEISTENLKSEEIVDNEMLNKVKVLNLQYPDLKGWLEIKDTEISYPVMQGNDNDFYITHTYEKEYSKWGSLFLDKDYDWSKPSSNLLIYGHNFSDGYMFADLLNYRNKEFYENHKTIRFITPVEDSEYEIISIFNSRVYYKHETDVFRYYFFVDAGSRAEYNDFVNNAKKASIYSIDATAEYGDQLITLSTCDYTQEDGRFVVVARKIKK